VSALAVDTLRAKRRSAQPLNPVKTALSKRDKLWQQIDDTSKMDVRTAVELALARTRHVAAFADDITAELARCKDAFGNDWQAAQTWIETLEDVVDPDGPAIAKSVAGLVTGKISAKNVIRVLRLLRADLDGPPAILDAQHSRVDQALTELHKKRTS